MKITVVGAGAIGGVIGAYLAKGGRDVELVDKVQEHVEKMNNDGLAIIAQQQTFVVPVRALTMDQLLDRGEPLECVLLCVKAQFTQEAVRSILPLLRENSFIISVQNGLCELEIAQIVGKERTLAGFVNIFADYLQPGVISYGGKGALSIGEMDGSMTPRLSQLKEEFSVLDRIEISDNVFGYLWGKLAYGAILTATALTNEEMADVFDNPRYRNMLMDIASEVLEVANYANAQPLAFDDWDPNDAYPREQRNQERMNRQLDIHVRRLRSYDKVRSGIWRDIAVRHRKTEKPYHFRPVFSLADESGISMPLCRKLLTMLGELENGLREFSVDNLEILLELDQHVYGVSV